MKKTLQCKEMVDARYAIMQKKHGVRAINNTGMPDTLKAGIENLSGLSMDNVRVHYNSSKPATVQALAYTQDADIHVAPGQEQHLPHEAWHVVQQMKGRVEPTTEIGGMPVNDNVGLEHEADIMGSRAMQLKSVSQFALSKAFRITIIGGVRVSDAEQAAAFITNLQSVRAIKEQNDAVIVLVTTSVGVSVDIIRNAFVNHGCPSVTNIERGKNTFYN